jgi:dolichol-phosphate mannosyltransferase
MGPVDLSVVVPTYNESGNLSEVIRRVSVALEGVDWEVVFVDDDSPDGTASLAKQMAAQNPRVRCIHRLGRRGLASACIEGMLSSSARFVAVMDADLQHDPALLRRMYDELAGNQVDLVVASRYMQGGSVGDWDQQRLQISQFATRLASLIMPQPVSDPMSGYFALRREVFDHCAKNLSSLGFKILLDILASVKQPLRIKELPFTFGLRHAGESKLSTNVAWEFLLLLLDKLFGKYVPVRFLAFASIGVIGVGVHFAVLALIFKGLGLAFVIGQGAATAIAILFNYTVNNLITYSDASLRGMKWLKGLLTFYLICGLGATANVGVSSYLFENQMSWALAAVTGITPCQPAIPGE